MTARPDHHAHIAALRQLHGREQPLHRRIGNTCDAIDRLQTGTRSWRAFAPKPAILDAAILQADGVARALRELRIALEDGLDAPPAA